MSKAEQILAGLGGADNVVEIEACITRLRTEVTDPGKVDEAALKAAGAVKDVFRRIDWLKVAKRAGGLALTTFTGIPTPDQVQAALVPVASTPATRSRASRMLNAAVERIVCGPSSLP